MSFIQKIKNALKITGGNPQSPQYWIKKLFGAQPSITGIEVDEYTAMKYSAFWAAVNIISGAVGFLPLVTFRRNLDNSRDRATNLQVYNLLHNRPNPYMSAQTLKETLTAHALVWGNGFAEIQFNQAGKPIALWPLMPNRTRPLYENDKLVYEVTQDGEPTKLDFSQVLHVHGLGFDGLKGYSILEFAADSLGINLATDQNAGMFYKNGSCLSGYLYTDSPLKSEVKEELEKSWQDKYGGEKKYRTAVLHSGLRYQGLGIPAKDAQLLESRKHGISDIARWFQIPPHMLADLERATFSNIEHQGIEFVTHTLQRWLQRWKHECDYKLFSQIEQGRYFTDFIVDMLLRGDSKTRAEVYQIALGGNNNPAYMTVNEVRQRENLPPVSEGNKLFMPGYGSQPDQQAMFEGIWGRVITKEVKAIRKALKHPENFTEWAEIFYEKHKSYMESIILPAVSACFGTANDAQKDIDRYIDQRRLDVITAFNDGSLSEKIEHWDIYEAENQTQLLLQGVKNE